LAGGAAIATAGSLVLGLNLGLALTFALAFTMLVTALRLRVSISGLTFKPAGRATVRVQRGGTATVEVETGSFTGALNEALSVRPPPGVEMGVTRSSGGRLELSVHPRYAGLFTGLETVYGIRDEMGLFLAEKSIRQESFRVESIPLNLTRETGIPSMAPVIFDENPAGVGGHGQEFYAIEEAEQAEARSVYWRGVARSSEGKMMVLVREAGLPDSVTIGVAEMGRIGVERLQWMDRASEAVAKLGRILLEWGIKVNILYASRDGLKPALAASIPELSQRIMQVWEGPPVLGMQKELIQRSDAVIVESALLTSSELASLLAEKPKLVIPLGALQQPPRESFKTFGVDEAERLVGEVLG
jgi:uncharacterized protein (DUF58 family)